MVAIPELDGLTQARRLGEAGQMAAEWIATMTDARVDQVGVHIAAVMVDGNNVLEESDRIKQLRAQFEALAEQIAILTRATARELVRHEVPVRDVGAVLDASPQRVSQLVNG